MSQQQSWLQPRHAFLGGLGIFSAVTSESVTETSNRGYTGVEIELCTVIPMCSKRNSHLCCIFSVFLSLC